MTPRPHERAARPNEAAIATPIRATIPTLTTKRLTLRAPAPEDFPVLLAISTGPQSPGIGGPMSRDEAWFGLAQMTATWVLRGHGWWAVTKDDETIGFVGIGLEPGDLEHELGYMFADTAQGQGYATEAVLAARDWAFGPLGLATCVSYINADNARSIAMAERVGAVRETPADWPHADTFVYRHRRPT